jgi:hypothetical protein
MAFASLQEVLGTRSGEEACALLQSEDLLEYLKPFRASKRRVAPAYMVRSPSS